MSSDGRKDRLTGKTIVDRYVIESLIARGGMAAVYRAHQMKLNRRVAIKILRPPPDSDENASFHERFRLEAETLAQLNHPNIVTVYDHGDFDDDQVFLAMEFVDGKRLTDALRDGPLPVERSLHLLLQVCEALRYAHRRGVVHRDLKPSNLLITETDDGDELVKVVDFGLVKLTEVDVTITSNGLILGSPHCMAPEQVRGQSVDPRTDIYAMGVLLFRCLTGTYPFHGNNSTATMIAHLNQATPTFFSVSPDLEVPDGLENVVRRCLAKNPKQRFQSMEELQEALAFFMNVTPDQYRTVSRSQATLNRYVPEVDRGRRNLRLAVIGGVGVLALGTVLCAGVLAGTSMMPRTMGRNIPLPNTDLPEIPGEADGGAGPEGGAEGQVAGGSTAPDADAQPAGSDPESGSADPGATDPGATDPEPTVVARQPDKKPDRVDPKPEDAPAGGGTQPAEGPSEGTKVADSTDPTPAEGTAEGTPETKTPDPDPDAGEDKDDKGGFVDWDDF